MQSCRFEIPDCPPGDVALLRLQLGVSDALAQILVRRGHREPAAAQAFLAADETHPPQAFAGIGDAVELLLRHLDARTRITVHGDYDVDGVCATAVLVRALGALGADVDHFIPDRAGDGYGLGAETVRRLAARGTRLLVTADCAITAVEEVELARSLGLEVLVSDHHAPREDGVLPRAAIVHPGVCGYPCPDLCATAVAHKLAQALVAAAGASAGGERVARADAALRADLDLVALATVADVVPLVGENRTLVTQGLRALAATTKPGLRELMAIARVAPATVGERAIAFALAPRLNAAGRLYRADAALELLLTDSPARAVAVAGELDDANQERRRVELGIRLEAEAQMRTLGERPAYVLAGEGWHPGVIGIVASRLVESSGRPVVLVALADERGRGSGRSIEGFDLLGALRACEAHLSRYGGHRAAAGLEIERARLGAFAEDLAAHAGERLRGRELLPLERVDAVVAGAQLGMGLAEELRALAPFGRGNPVPALMVADATFSDIRPMGEGKHARFTVHSGAARARAVAFGSGVRLAGAEGEAVQATFTLEVNEWNGVSEPRLVLRRAQAPAPQPAPTETPSDREPIEAGGGRLALFALP